MTYQTQELIFTQTSKICRDKQSTAQQIFISVLIFTRPCNSFFKMSENNLRVPGSESDQQSGDNIGQQGQEKVRKSSLVTTKNPLRKLLLSVLMRTEQQLGHKILLRITRTKIRKMVGLNSHQRKLQMMVDWIYFFLKLEIKLELFQTTKLILL
jgi:hypothetical protein